MFRHVLIALAAGWACAAQANVVITGTRVVYPAEQASVSVQLNNRDALPSLIQAWIDDGDSERAPSALAVPFLITPPVARIEPNTGQTLRIVYTGEPLATDRETLFFLNVLDVPPAPVFEEADASQNYLQIAIRSRLKLFFRPPRLTPAIEQAPARVNWQLREQDGQPVLAAANPTPYHLNYESVWLGEGEQAIAVEALDMLAPFETRLLPLPATRSPDWRQVHWRLIDDYGGHQPGASELR